jgi:hypothetical protein
MQEEAERSYREMALMEAASSTEMSVNFYQTTRLTIPEDSHLHTRRREDIKSHLL